MMHPPTPKAFETSFTESKSEVFLVDTTLRDGEQTAGVVFANQEKARIARVLSEIGVHEIEAGSPWLCVEERESITQIAGMGLQARVLAFCHAVPQHVELAADCGVQGVVISASTSQLHVQRKYAKDRGWVLEQLVRTATVAREKHLPFIVSAEDASRTNMAFLLQYAVLAEELGAERFRFCDSLSVLDPFTAFQRLQTVVEGIGIDVEVHCHNDFGMATANTLAGIRAGAKHVTVSINGLGERTGNAALEEVVMALKHLDGVDLHIATGRFREISEYVARASSRAIPIWKAIVGTNIFAHESGIHADGVIKNPVTYEVFSPDEVGLTRQLVVGKHSGSRTIQHKFKEFGIDLSDIEANVILAHARQMSVDLKRALFDKELMYIYQDFVQVDEARKTAERVGIMDDDEE
jgi:homocitrate synthase NifV